MSLIGVAVPQPRALSFVTVLLAALLLSAAVLPARAQDVIRVAFNTYPPAVTADALDRPCGYDIRLLEMLLDSMGLTPEYHRFPFKRSLVLMENGEMDLMLGVLRRAERESYLHYVEPPYVSELTTAFYVRKGDEERIRKHEDLYALRVGTGLGVRYYPRFDQDGRVQKDPVRAGRMNFERLAAGRVDAVIMNEEVGDHRVGVYGLDESIGKADYVHRGPQQVYMVLSRKSRFAPRLDEFSRVLGELVASGARERLREESLGKARRSGRLPGH